MISLITCSRDEESLQKLKQNVLDTIGVPHEWIVINNGDRRFGICEAYNSGALRAQYDILCFLHEDILFETKGWGQRLATHLSDHEVGLVGVAGGATKSLVPSSWASFIHPSEMSIVQHFKSQVRAPERIIRTSTPDDPSVLKPVVCVDGVFLCTRKDVFAVCRFDQDNLPDFHGYDIDFSLQVAQHFRVCVCFDIVLHHFSEGSFNRDWLDACEVISNKWSRSLPASVHIKDQSQLVHQHWTSMRVFLGKMITLDYSLDALLNGLFRYSFNRYFHLLHFLHFLRLVIAVKLVPTKKSLEKLGIRS
jgi:glycosyltransferase involved in cell wall biosynthesis